MIEKATVKDLAKDLAKLWKKSGRATSKIVSFFLLRLQVSWYLYTVNSK